MRRFSLSLSLLISAAALADDEEPVRDTVGLCCLPDGCVELRSSECETAFAAAWAAQPQPAAPVDAAEVATRPHIIEADQRTLAHHPSRLVQRMRVVECIPFPFAREEKRSARVPDVNYVVCSADPDPCDDSDEVVHLAWKLPEVGDQGIKVYRPPHAGQLYWVYRPQHKKLRGVDVVGMAEYADEKELSCSR